MNTTRTVIKQSGLREHFDSSKLKKSLLDVGANDQTALMIIDEIEQGLLKEISSEEIHEVAIAGLTNTNLATASRYNLKKAIMKLGPTGFPFEKYVCEILKHQGFKTKVGVIVRGTCVNHEVDVVAERKSKHYMIECKFHSKPGRHCDVKIPLYIQSRFKDVESQWRKQPGHDTKFHQGWIFTNTRFTTDAMEYAACSGLALVSWDYPRNKGLKDLVGNLGLYPISCLSTLSEREQRLLLDKGIVLSKELHDNPSHLNSIGLGADQQEKILSEVRSLCEMPKSLHDEN